MVKNSIFCLIAFLFASIAQANRNYVEGEVIVRLKGKMASLESQSFLGKISANSKLSRKGSWSGLNMHHYKVKPGNNVDVMINELKQNPEVLYVEPNYIMNKQDLAGVMGEPMTASQFESFASSQSFSLTSANIQAPQAWGEVSSGSSRPIVAVIDTGVDLDHPAFANWCAIWENSTEVLGTPGVDDDGNGFVDDYNGWNFVSNNNNPDDDDGHGTHVAGIVFGTTQDLGTDPAVMPVSGVCDPSYLSMVRIMPLKFLDSNGSGSTTAAINAIYYATNNGAHILNNSWGGGGASLALQEAIVYSYERGRLFVAAAGNAANNNDISPLYPASYDVPNVMSVASSRSNDYLSSFSNFGVSTVHLASPGSGIYSSVPNGLYATLSGTSMAAPFVAGTAALMIREMPGVNGFQLKELINSSGDSLSQLSAYTISGKRLNVLSAVNLSKASSVDSFQPNYQISFSASNRELASAVASGGTGCGLVKSILNGNDDDKGPPSAGKMLGLLWILLLPIVFAIILRTRISAEQRLHERFLVNGDISLKVGGKEVSASLDTISIGGAGFQVDQMIDKGSLVTMKIQSPDGRQEFEVEARVVWNEESKSHGVQFVKTKQSVVDFIQKWSKNLVRE